MLFAMRIASIHTRLFNIHSLGTAQSPPNESNSCFRIIASRGVMFSTNTVYILHFSTKCPITVSSTPIRFMWCAGSFMKEVFRSPFTTTCLPMIFKRFSENNFIAFGYMMCSCSKILFASVSGESSSFTGTAA